MKRSPFRDGVVGFGTMALFVLLDEMFDAERLPWWFAVAAAVSLPAMLGTCYWAARG